MLTLGLLKSFQFASAVVNSLSNLAVSKMFELFQDGLSHMWSLTGCTETFIGVYNSISAKNSFLIR